MHFIVNKTKNQIQLYAVLIQQINTIFWINCQHLQLFNGLLCKLTSMKTEKAQFTSVLRRCLKYTQLYSVEECLTLKISSRWNYRLYRVDLSNKMNAEYKIVITVCKAYFVFLFFLVFLWRIPHPNVTLTKFWIYGIHYILFFFTMVQQPYWAKASTLSRIHDHSQTHHTR